LRIFASSASATDVAGAILNMVDVVLVTLPKTATSL